MESQQSALNFRRTVLWGWIIVFTAALFPFLFWTMTATNFEYTYLRPPSAPGTLRSERWSRDFFFIGSLLLLFLVPLTAAFMAENPCKHGRRTAHIFVVVLLFLLYATISGFWIFDYANANKAEAWNAHNNANDYRWCCVNFAIVGSDCLNTVACTPGVGQGDLIANRSFVFRFGYLLAFLFLLIVDFVYVMAVFQRAVQDYVAAWEINSFKKGLTTPTAPPQMEAEPAKQQLLRSSIYTSRKERK